jgi:hypothetical protein
MADENRRRRVKDAPALAKQAITNFAVAGGFGAVAVFASAGDMHSTGSQIKETATAHCDLLAAIADFQCMAT